MKAVMTRYTIRLDAPPHNLAIFGLIYLKFSIGVREFWTKSLFNVQICVKNSSVHLLEREREKTASPP